MSAGLDPVLAATSWKSNAHLIEDVARLGYLKSTDVVLDPTYGLGAWWKRWRPAHLETFSREDTPDFDFRAIPADDESYDAVAYDPPYVSKGGRKPSGMDSMNQHYGLTDAPRTPALLQILINEGMDECVRVLKPGGVLLVKTMDYISGGKFFPSTFNTYNHALLLDLTLEDRFLHLTKPRPQDEERTQRRARNNVSTLFVFRKAK